ncbi:MAG: nucleoside-diphosphate kinase [Candidatus Kerfeldbacteria bacterium CG08_land_8_20_14_0_20_43_14]|uniref:nucleoside-diphosphate kinase n=1 Tax=Candidatus Kerfeldbacteria bacterium CG08_land_8_20_14_0_20_43_14 TaxID=2014246 RepID=A0A2H0YSD2_9BACT|nr:MAG: nucleoside-diphosphate kinase [Candidatus Kerfeldbacteria bacterium CG08_land_8_20_14_0_20_43_14]
MSTPHPREERTLVLVKPDGVKRGLIGEIMHRIEQRGLKIIALKMIWATKPEMDKHYPKDEVWITRLGEKTKKTYDKYGYDLKGELGTEDLFEIGKMVRGWLLDFMTAGPVVKMVVQGVHAVDMIRKIAGNTMPYLADMGTVRGDYSVDSAAAANKEKRSVHNIMHASETTEEAKNEIANWFTEDEIYVYKRIEEDIQF